MNKAVTLLLLGGISLLVLLSLINAGIILGLDSRMDAKISQIKEASRPASIQLILIQPDCDGCTDASPLIEKIKQSNINLTSEQALSPQDASSLIDAYGIKRLPAIILEGEVGKISAPNFEARGKGLVYDQIAPPYYDPASGAVRGRVDAQVIDAPSSCKQCLDMKTIVDIFTQQGMFFASDAEFKADDPQAQKLIRDNGIAVLPALIFSEDAEAYPNVLQVMTQGGFKKSGDLYVYESHLPYYNLSDKKVYGLVELIMLTDKGCTACYDVSLHKQILANFGVAISSEKTVDISSAEGQQLLQQHGITSVPTIILKGDAVLYPGFSDVWGTVGTIGKDNTFVFRDNGALGAGFSYKNLTSGEVITVPAENPSA